MTPAFETAPAESRYLGPDDFARNGPAMVRLGALGEVRSPIPAPLWLNYLSVQMRAGEVLRYHPPAGHDVALIAVHEGRVTTPQVVSAGELAIFAELVGAVDFRAQVDSEFMLGSAVKHRHDLVLGHYLVHSTADALEFR